MGQWDGGMEQITRRTDFGFGVVPSNRGRTIGVHDAGAERARRVCKEAAVDTSKHIGNASTHRMGMSGGAGAGGWWGRTWAMVVLAMGLGLVVGGCAKDRTMMVMVRDAGTQAAVVGAEVNVRTTQGTSTSGFNRSQTRTGEDGSVLISAPMREAIQLTVETDDGSYGRFVIDHPAMGVSVPWRSPGAIGYEYGPRKFQISAIEWEGGKSERSPKVKWEEPTVYKAPPAAE